MRRYRVGLDPEAIADLKAIRTFVAEAAGNAIAEKLIDRVLAYIDGLDTAPKRGAARDDIRPGLRTITWRRTMTLIFVVDDGAGTVVVIAALYRGRDVDAALRDRLG
jgi:plasmid stabilization system protein ParE